MNLSRPPVNCDVDNSYAATLRVVPFASRRREREELYEVCRKECRDGECQLAVANGGTCPLELIR